MPKKQPPPPSFEDSLHELESLVETLERGDLPLDESLKTFERGIELTRACQQALREAEQKVQLLSEKHESAELEPFDREN